MSNGPEMLLVPKDKTDWLRWFAAELRTISAKYGQTAQPMADEALGIELALCMLGVAEEGESSDGTE